MNQTIEAIEERETIQPAEINQRIGYSKIIGEGHRSSVHYIAEYIPGRGGQYRLKTVSFEHFSSEKELISYCVEHKIVLDQLKETHRVRTPKKTEWWKSPQYSKTQVEGENDPKKLPSGLNEQQYRFCVEYLLCRNATRAYMVAYPSVKNANSAGASASYLLKKPQVKTFLESRGFVK